MHSHRNINEKALQALSGERGALVRLGRRRRVLACYRALQRRWRTVAAPHRCWNIVNFVEGRPLSRYTAHAIREYPTANGPADYAFVVDGVMLGIIEAKKVTLGPQNVLTQAERYSHGVAESPFNFHGYRVPFLYSTNGSRDLSSSRRAGTRGGD